MLSSNTFDISINSNICYIHDLIISYWSCQVVMLVQKPSTLLTFYLGSRVHIGVHSLPFVVPSTPPGPHPLHSTGAGVSFWPLPLLPTHSRLCHHPLSPLLYSVLLPPLEYIVSLNHRTTLEFGRNLHFINFSPKVCRTDQCWYQLHCNLSWL